LESLIIYYFIMDCVYIYCAWGYTRTYRICKIKNSSIRVELYINVLFIMLLF